MNNNDKIKEEIGGFDFGYHRETGVTHGMSVLGTLRCNWGEGKVLYICLILILSCIILVNLTHLI